MSKLHFVRRWGGVEREEGGGIVKKDYRSTGNWGSIAIMLHLGLRHRF